MKRLIVLPVALVSLAGIVFADVVVGPSPADFLPTVSSDPTTLAVMVGVPVVVLVAIAILLLWFVRHKKK